MDRSRRGLGWGRLAAAGLVSGAVTFGEVTPSRAAEPSPAYRASLKRTAELRRQRRQAQAGADRAPVGTIVPWPMPPTLVIRHTRETHDEIGALLDLLRYGGR